MKVLEHTNADANLTPSEDWEISEVDSPSAVDAKIAAAIAAFAATLAKSGTHFFAVLSSAIGASATRTFYNSSNSAVTPTQNYPQPPRRVTEVKFHQVGNTYGASVTHTLLKNGVPTACAATFLAGATGLVSSVHDVDFADGDSMDISSTVGADSGVQTGFCSINVISSPILP